MQWDLCYAVHCGRLSGRRHLSLQSGRTLSPTTASNAGTTFDPASILSKLLAGAGEADLAISLVFFCLLLPPDHQTWENNHAKKWRKRWRKATNTLDTMRILLSTKNLIKFRKMITSTQCWHCNHQDRVESNGCGAQLCSLASLSCPIFLLAL